MASRKENMKILIQQRDQLLSEIEALKNKVAGLEMAIGLLGGETVSSTADAGSPARRINVKATILDLLKEVGTTGLNAATTVEIAARRGIELDRASVSSLLSRLKREGTVNYDGEKYRLPEFEHQAQRPAVSVVRGGQ
jgi:DNA-binding transcriptional regulator LsrR (DeoR family)